VVGTGAPKVNISLPHLPSLFSLLPTVLFTALGVLRMLPVLQQLGDAYSP